MLATISAVTSSVQLLGDLRTPTLVVEPRQSRHRDVLADRPNLRARTRRGAGAGAGLARALDCTLEQCSGSGTLALGLNNDFGDAAHYWARAAGKARVDYTPGVSLEELDGFAALRRGIDNTNDGKRSEWVNFLRVGGEVDILPDDPAAALRAAGGEARGVQRCGRPRRPDRRASAIVFMSKISSMPSTPSRRAPASGGGRTSDLRRPALLRLRPRTENFKQSENFAYFYGQTRTNSNITGITGILYSTTLTTKFCPGKLERAAGRARVGLCNLLSEVRGALPPRTGKPDQRAVAFKLQERARSEPATTL